jgi:chromosome segregation ATPase
MTNITKRNKTLGRKATLVPEKIIETIQAIQNEGGNVTPCIIRRKIGFGGLENISKILDSYLKEQVDSVLVKDNPIENHILPPDLEDKANILLGDLSQQINNFLLESDLLANTLAEKRARSAYDSMIENNKKLVDEQSLTIKMFDEVEAKNDELNEQIAEIETILENERVKSSALDADLSKANDELTRLRLLISNIEVGLSSSETKNKSFEKLITKLETRLEDSIKDKDNAVNESIKIRTQLTEISSKLKSSDAMVDQLKSDMNTLRADKDKAISELQSKNSNLSSKLEKAQSEHQIAKEQLIATTVQLSSQKETLKEKNERITDLKNQLAELKTIN